MVGAFFKNQSRTVWYMIVGLIAGLLVGHAIGGIGVAMRGAAFAIPTGTVLAVVGAIVGFRAGRKSARQTKGGPASPIIEG